MSVELNDITSGYSTGLINDNFKLVEDELNNNVLRRDGLSSGEANQMEVGLDMNSNFVYNLPEPVLEHQAARLQDVQNAIAGADQANLVTFTPYKRITSENLQGAVQQVVDGERSVENLVSYGATGDGVTSDQTAIEAAVSASITSGLPVYWPPGTYLSTSTVDNFHDVWHIGEGSVLRDGVTYYPSPKDGQVATLFVADAGTTSNDGLSPNNPTVFTEAISRLKAIGPKAQYGTWRVQFAAETTTQTGARLIDMPQFKNKLEILGNVSAGVPTTVWDGTSNAEAYAIRSDFFSLGLNLHIEGFEWTDWSSGNVVAWGGIDVTMADCISRRSGSNSLWFRSGVTRIDRVKVYDSGVNGVSAQYHCKFEAYDCVFNGCTNGVLIGRNGVGRIDTSTFDGNSSNAIQVLMASRFRSAGNTYSNSGSSHINIGSTSVWNNDLSTPDTFTDLSPTQVGVDTANGGQAAHLPGIATPNVIFNWNDAFGHSATAAKTSLADYTTGRIAGVPGYTFFNPKACLHIELDLSINANKSTLIELTGEGGGTTIASIQLPTASVSADHEVHIKVYGPHPGSGSGRFVATSISSDGGVMVSRGGVNFVDTTLRNSTGDQLIYRVYLTNTDTNTFVNVGHIRSWIEF